MADKQQHIALHIDRDTFRHLYESYWTKVFGVCFRVLQDTDLAKELAQDIFESLWRRKDTLVITGNPEAYLVRAAKLEVFQYIRNQNIRQVHLDSYRDQVPQSINSTQEDVHYAELSSRMDELLESLPPKRQQIYRLNFEGANHREIASAMNVSEKTVEYHIGKTRSFLRRHLKDYKS